MVVSSTEWRCNCGLTGVDNGDVTTCYITHVARLTYRKPGTTTSSATGLDHARKVLPRPLPAIDRRSMGA